MKEITSEKRDHFIQRAVEWNYMWSHNKSDEAIVADAQNMLVTDHPELFAGKIGEAMSFVNSMIVDPASAVKKDDEVREYDSFIKKMAETVLTNMSPFMIETKYEKEPEPVVDEVPAYEETVEVDNNATDSDNNMAKIDFGFGTAFDPDQINKEMAEQFDPSNPARAFLQQPEDILQPMPQMVPQQAPMMPPMGFVNPMMVPQQPVMMHPQGVCADPNCACHHANPQPVIHKVDETPKPKKTPPAEDKVDHNLEKIQINDLKKPPIVKQAPEIIQPLEPAPPVNNTVQNMYDNTEIANKYTKIPLLEIQAIANQNACSVKLEEYPAEGIISVATFDHVVNQPVPQKSFCIDTGMIIDKRAKLIMTNPVFNQEVMLEQAPMYELTVSSSGGNKKGLDAKLITDIFTAGYLNITKKEMYSENYKALNQKLALITLPTKGLNKEERNALQDYIVKMDQEGYLDKAIQMAPGSRFVFIAKQLNKTALADFILVNQGVPRFYGTEPLKVLPVIIESKSGKIDIRTQQ